MFSHQARPFVGHVAAPSRTYMAYGSPEIAGRRPTSVPSTNGIRRRISSEDKMSDSAPRPPGIVAKRPKPAQPNKNHRVPVPNRSLHKSPRLGLLACDPNFVVLL